MEIGAGVGFLAAHCANIRGDLIIALQEENAGLHQMLLTVCVISERTFNNSFRLLDQRLGSDLAHGALAMIARETPDALLLADPGFSPQILAAVLQAPVSYTHLDVYKRQGIHRQKMKTTWQETDFTDQVKWPNGSGREMEDCFKFRGWR